MSQTVHNPDRYMADLRQILAQGRKRIGLLLGAGTPAAIKVNPSTGQLSSGGVPLIPAVAGLTAIVIKSLDTGQKEVIQSLSAELGDNPNIEMILSKVRSLAAVIGTNKIYGLNGQEFSGLGQSICAAIGDVVGATLPNESNPYTELVSWVSGIDRKHAIEIYTPNYDLLLEEALERAKQPYFDGFTGAHEPFFDPSTISNDDLPPRWGRLWKLHGSLGWAMKNGKELVRRGDRIATELIYPDHLKYDQIQKLPYTAFFDRLRKFLSTPDTLLISCGFSYFDSHISAVIDEALTANPSASVFAFQHSTLEKEQYSSELAKRRPNMSVYASDGAIINCISAVWRPGDLPSPDWAVIRASNWAESEVAAGNCFVLGDFNDFSRFVALAQAEQANVPQSYIADE